MRGERLLYFRLSRGLLVQYYTTKCTRSDLDCSNTVRTSNRSCRSVQETKVTQRVRWREESGKFHSDPEKFRIWGTFTPQSFLAVFLLGALLRRKPSPVIPDLAPFSTPSALPFPFPITICLIAITLSLKEQPDSQPDAIHYYCYH